MVRVQDLAKIALLDGLEEKTLELVTRIAVPRRYRKGEAIFSEGEPGTGFHVVAAGRVKFFKLSRGGEKQIRHVWGPDEPFGEVAALEGRPYPAHAVALEDCATAYLLLLDERQGGNGRVDLDLTKGQLADLLGTMPETLSRILARFVRDGMLETMGPRGYSLLDRAALEDLAAGTRRLG